MVNQFYVKTLRLLSVILVIIGVFFFVKHTFLYVYPFFIALFFAFLLHPFVKFVELKWKVSRTISTSSIMICFFTLIFFIFYVAVKRLLKEATSLIQTLPEQLQKLKLIFADIGQTYFLPFYEKVASTITILPPLNEWEFKNYIDFFVDEIGISSSFYLKNIVLTTSTILTSLSYFVTIVIFILLAVFMITKDFEQLRFQLQKVIPKRFLINSRRILVHLKKSVFGFVKAQIIMTIFSSFIVMIGLYIFKVKNVLMVTLIALVVDFVPYIG